MMTEMSQVRIGGKWKKVVVVVARAIATGRGTNMCKCPDVEGNIYLNWKELLCLEQREGQTERENMMQKGEVLVGTRPAGMER